MRSSPLMLRWGEFAACRTLYDSLSKHNLAARPVCRPRSGFGSSVRRLLARLVRREEATRPGTRGSSNDNLSYYIDPVGGVTEAGGNNFWGVEVWTHPETGEEYILASDRDSGLWIFQDP